MTTSLSAPTPITSNAPGAQPDPWDDLRAHTQARLALGRAGASMPTGEWLQFGMAHAQARDAVHLPLDVDALARDLQALDCQTLTVHSSAPDRASYLLRPDLGRRLSEADAQALCAQFSGGDAGNGDALDGQTATPFDLVLVVADGLSSLAVQRQAPRLIEALLAQQSRTGAHWRIGPVVIAQQARVAIGDEIGALINARMVAVLVGERPGLSSPDSLGIYLTWHPQVGRTDAQRNCISNVRPEGLPPPAAAARLWWLCQEARQLGVTGVGLKDRSDAVTLPAGDRGAAQGSDALAR